MKRAALKRRARSLRGVREPGCWRPLAGRPGRLPLHRRRGQEESGYGRRQRPDWRGLCGPAARTRVAGRRGSSIREAQRRNWRRLEKSRARDQLAQAGSSIAWGPPTTGAEGSGARPEVAASVFWEGGAGSRLAGAMGARGRSPDDLEPRGAIGARGAGVPGPSVMEEVVDRRRSPADGQARRRPCSGAALRRGRG